MWGGMAPFGRHRRRIATVVAVDARLDRSTNAVTSDTTGRSTHSVAADVSADNGRLAPVRLATTDHGASGSDLRHTVRWLHKLRADR